MAWLVSISLVGAVLLLSTLLALRYRSARHAAEDGLDALEYEPGEKAKRADSLVSEMKWDDAARLGAVAVKPLIAQFTNAPTSYMRLSAAEALERIGGAAIEPLIVAHQDYTLGKNVCFEAEQLLVTIVASTLGFRKLSKKRYDIMQIIHLMGKTERLQADAGLLIQEVGTILGLLGKSGACTFCQKPVTAELWGESGLLYHQGKWILSCKYCQREKIELR